MIQYNIYNLYIYPIFIQRHCYNFAHENVGNPALNTRPTILNLFFSAKMVLAGYQVIKKLASFPIYVQCHCYNFVHDVILRH